MVIKLQGLSIALNKGEVSNHMMIATKFYSIRVSVNPQHCLWMQVARNIGCTTPMSTTDLHHVHIRQINCPGHVMIKLYVQTVCLISQLQGF